VPGMSLLDTGAGIFSYASNDDVIRAVVQGPDGSLVAPQHPLHLGETGVVYADALGATEPIVPDRQAAPSDPPAHTIQAVELLANDLSQQVLYGPMKSSSGCMAWRAQRYTRV
jgi:uncharacterized protein (TIGR03437 family)